MSNRYKLTKKAKDKWCPIIKDFLDTLDNWKPEYDFNMAIQHTLKILRKNNHN